MSRLPGLTAVLLATLVVVLAACGGGDSTTDSETSTSETSTTETGTGTSTSEDGDESPDVELLGREDFEPCLEEAGVQIENGARSGQISSEIRERAEGRFTINFPDEEFGPQVQNVVVLPFDRPAVTRMVLTELREELGEDRRIIRRENVLVVFGERTTSDALRAVADCVREEE